MEPLMIIFVSGPLGGIVLALLLMLLRLGARSAVAGGRLAPIGVINIAQIRVEGIGGLGMVAMAATVAVFEPSIRFAMAIAFPLGVALAAVLIALRRGGPLSSSSNLPGAHSMLPFNGGQRQAELRSSSQPAGSDRPSRADLAGSAAMLTVAR